MKELPIAIPVKESIYMGSDKNVPWHSILKYSRFDFRFGVRSRKLRDRYIRSFEYPLVLSRVDAVDGMRLLDVGSGSTAIFPLYVASRFPSATVYATDVWNEALVSARSWARRAGLENLLAKGRVILERQDATQMTCCDGYFDRVTAISTLEHLPEGEDALGCQEIARVLRPGGRAVITVPYAEHYDEEYRTGGVYGQQSDKKPIFYQRHYDDETLKSRLVEPSGLKVVELLHWGQRCVDFEQICMEYLEGPRWRRALAVPLQPFVALLVSLFLHIVEPDRRHQQAIGVLLVLEKEKQEE